MRIHFTNTGFKKINIGFGVLVVIALLHAVISFSIIRSNNQTVTRMTNEIDPYVASLKSFSLLVTESKMYSTNWVYLQVNEDDKKNLIKLHNKKYPALKKELLTETANIGNKADEDSLKKIFLDFDQLM